MLEAKEIIFNHEAREKLSRGISKLANAVRGTLGPKGRNVGLEKSWGAPIITNDGHSIVRDIELPDQFENMGVAMAKEVATQLKEKCGDGTTTASLLLESLVQQGVKLIAAGASPVNIKRGIETAVAAVVKELEKLAIAIKSPEEICNIATVSASGNRGIGKCIAEALDKVGREGVVMIEESKGIETTIELVEGMQFNRGYISPYFVTNQEKMIVEMEHPFVLLVDKKIASIHELLPVLQAIVSTGRALLVIAEDVESDALATLVVNKLRGTLKVAAVKAPGFGDSRKALLGDLAVLTGATVVSEEAGITLKDVGAEVLGSAERAVITKEKSLLIKGRGSRESIEARLRQIENELEKSTSSYDREKLNERKAKLAGGIAVIKVGAATEPELKQKKQAFEDSLSSTKAALEEGIVVGGGVALLKAGKALDYLVLEGDAALGRDLVRKMVEAPVRQIIENAGHDSSIIIAEIRGAEKSIGFNAMTNKVEDLFKAGVIDPLKVVKHALLYAASCGGMVLISEALIGDAAEDKE